MSVLSAVVVTIGTTPPGQYTGIDVPLLFLNVSIPTERPPVESCKILSVNEVDPEGGLVRTKAVMSSDAVSVNVCAVERSSVTSLEEIDDDVTDSEYVLNLVCPSI